MNCSWGNSVVKDHKNLHLRHDKDDDEQEGLQLRRLHSFM